MPPIQGAPLAVSPGQLGQMMLRSGAIPENLVRPGQTLQLLVLQDAKAGEKTQVQIAGRNLEAMLPGPVGAGQQIQVRVTRAAAEGVQLRLVEVKPGPPAMRVPAELQNQIQNLAARNGGQVQVQVAPGGKEILVAGQSFQPAQLGLSQIPALPRWTAELRMMPGGIMQLAAVFPERSQQLRGLAGDLVLSRQAKLIETGVDMSQQIQESEKTYDSQGQTAIGPAWMQLPDGTPVAVGQKPTPEENGESWSAQFSLHGVALGEVGIRLTTSSAGIQIHVHAAAAHAQLLQDSARELETRIRQITNKPAQVRIAQQEQIPDRPPGGYQYYG